MIFLKVPGRFAGAKRFLSGFTPLEIKRRRRLTVARGNLSLTGLAPLKTIGKSERRMMSLTGFTLIEALLAIGVGVLVLTSAYSSLRVGWLSYRRLNSQAHIYQNLRNGLSIFAKDLRNSFLFDASDEYPIVFSGNSKEMSFVSLVVSRNEEGETYAGAARVFYKIEGNSLLRAYLKGRDMFNQSLSPEYEVFLSNISEAGFLYSASSGKSSQTDQLNWKDSFEDEAALPQAVRLKLTQKVDDAKDIISAKSVILKKSYSDE